VSLEAGFVDPLLRSSLLIGLAWAAAFGLRGAGSSAAMRHFVWLAGLVSIALIPLLAAWLPRLPLPILPETIPSPVPAPLPPTETIVAAPVASSAAAPATIGLGDVVQLFYLAVAAGLLGRLALGHWLLARLWQRSRPIEDRALTVMVEALAGSLGIGRPVAVQMATGPAMPMTWGTVRPRILLPSDASGWDDEKLRVVLMHELAHVARHDSLSRTATAIVCALYWFNPAVWYAVRQMRREQEHACDDLVLSLGAKASVYARNLLEAAHAFQAPRIVASLSVAMASPSELERRLTAIVSPASRRRASLRFLLGCGAAALVATSVAASVVPVPADLRVLPDGGDGRPIRRAAAPGESLRAAVPAAPTPAIAPAAEAAPVPPTAPAPAVASPPPVAPAAPVADAADYEAALAEYRRDVRVYRVALARYHEEVRDYRRQLRSLRDAGNLSHAGDTGHAGSFGTVGHPPLPAGSADPVVPAELPTPPVPPTPPTPPTPLKASQQGP
jgi:beta-lactamase regulating signal transducer with metallopeptidase domain